MPSLAAAHLTLGTLFHLLKPRQFCAGEIMFQMASAALRHCSSLLCAVKNNSW